MDNTTGDNKPDLRPLAGVRIVDMSTVLMGPLASQILGDYGADVVKVEPPQGDVARHAGASKLPGMASLYIAANRNKRSIVLDVKLAEGKAALLELCRTADIFMHNVRPDAMRRAGLDYDALRAINPKLIYLALVGFGEGGCYAGLPAFDDIMQGAAGVAGLFLQAGHPEPVFIPWNVADRMTGITAVHAALAALLLRARTGEGQAVEVPMFETIVQLVMGDHMGGLTFDPPQGPAGYARLLSPGRKPYPTADGFIVVTPYNDKQFSALFDLLELPADVREQPMFRTMEQRQKNWPSIYAAFSQAFTGRKSDEWVKLCHAAEIPCTPVRTVSQLLDDPHLRDVGLFETSEHPAMGTIRQTRPSTRWSTADVSIRRHAPVMGEHSAQILREMGYSDARIDELIRSGATRVAGAHDGS
ncbi:MAG TPA: CoA transferase [Burkholderiaceae bacterium]|nr:CoA transferase [Burkholderiaceae bacterium]